MPALDAEHFEFENFVKQKMGVKSDFNLSAEWCFCGRGIPMLYEFLLLKHTGEKLKDPIRGEDVFLKVKTNAIAKKTINRFLWMLGATLLCNSAVLLPDDGIVLCGNIINAVLGYMVDDMADVSTSYFYKGFYGNTKLKSYLETVNIYITSEADLNLKGCLVCYTSLRDISGRQTTRKVKSVDGRRTRKNNEDGLNSTHRNLFSYR